MSDEEPLYNVTTTYYGAVEDEEGFDDFGEATEYFYSQALECELGENDDWVVSLYDTFENVEKMRRSGIKDE